MMFIYYSHGDTTTPFCGKRDCARRRWNVTEHGKAYDYAVAAYGRNTNENIREKVRRTPTEGR